MSCSVVVLVGDNVDPGELVLSVLGGPALQERVSVALGMTAVVTLVSWPVSSKPLDVTSTLQVTSTQPLLDRVLQNVGANALRNTLHRTPIGRLFNSLGPLDPARVFWRRVRRSPEVIMAIATADHVIAVDSASVRTAWTSLHRSNTRSALFGLLGSLRWLETRPAPRACPADLDDQPVDGE